MAPDSANIKVCDFDCADLEFTDAQLAALTRMHSHEVIERVPGFRWWSVDDSRKMSLPVNICGHVQRAWDFYCSIRFGIQMGNVGLGIGTGGIGAPGILTTDKYCGESPHPVRYPSANGYSHMTLDADSAQWPYHDNQFGCVIFDHSFEHLANQETAVREAYRIIKPQGAVCILQPCMAYNRRGTIDPTHTTEWAADQFLEWVTGLNLDNAKILTHNLIQTEFSFETVIQKQ